MFIHKLKFSHYHYDLALLAMFQTLFTSYATSCFLLGFGSDNEFT